MEELQVRVITLEETSPLLAQLQTLFPRADVGIQRGIDVRRSPVELLHASELITHTVVHTLKNGRKWHHEVPTKGAIGLAQANRLALEEDPSRPLLLLEADCAIKDAERLERQVAQLLFHADRFDMAAFGCYYKGARGGAQSAAWLPDGFKVLKDSEDAREGTNAFAEKRPPQWKGR